MNEDKVFYIFSWLSYAPNGGWGDYLGEVNTIDEAKESIMRGVHDYAQIINPRNKNIVLRGYRETGALNIKGDEFERWIFYE